MHWIALQPQPEHAQANCPQRLAPELADEWSALAWWALQFTPRVARVEDALVLEVSASERLWGGRQQLMRHIFELSKPVTPVKQAQGATSLIAIARLQDSSSRCTAADHLPLAALAAARPHLATLELIGCCDWGQLRALPRAGVARRFGAPLLDALDRAYGLKPELYPWLLLPEVFEATLELPTQVETAPALLFGAHRLFGLLQVWLKMRHSGVLAIELMWTMDARRDTATRGELVLRTAEPALEMTHLLRLLGEQLARITLPAPVLYLRLRTLETQKLGGQSASLLPDEQPTGDSLQQLLERLGARLGGTRVLQLQDRFDHRPEQMQVWQPVSNATKLIAACAYQTEPEDLKHIEKEVIYPNWLLAMPQKLVLRGGRPQYPGALTLLAGPQRIEAGWWGQGETALRDYFLARSEQMGLLWIYRERLSGPGGTPGANPDWYLHGLFA